MKPLWRVNTNMPEIIPDPNAPPVTPLTGVVEELTPPEDRVIVSCGCDTIPLVLTLDSNFFDLDIIKGFLARNGLSINNTLNMRFNDLLGSWQTNLHFNGLSNNNFTEESWNILFEWACTSRYGQIDLGISDWKFSMLVIKRNTAPTRDASSRILVLFPPEAVCFTEKVVNFTFSISSTGTISTDSGIAPNIGVFSDNIGLFNSGLSLDITIQQDSGDILEPIPRKNIRPIAPIKIEQTEFA